MEDSDLEDEDVGSEMIVEDEEYEGYDDDDDVLTRATDNDPIPIYWSS